MRSPPPLIGFAFASCSFSDEYHAARFELGWSSL
jgi:hypothetical protein